MTPLESNRYWRIGIATALMAAATFVGGRILLSGSNAPQAGKGNVTSPSAEAGESPVTPPSGTPGEDVPALPGGRTLQSFYQRRAYSGAPPVIPHRLPDAKAWGGASCLACHKDGGYTPEFRAMAPVTPHPELKACVQCHVPQQESAGAFRGTTFTRLAPPKIDNSALGGAPPPIPHDLQMRSNCRACHVGPAAVRELRRTHPEFGDCLQCHQPNAELPKGEGK